MTPAWIDSGRYYLALMLWVCLPPAILYWLVVHPFAAFWRRVGPALTFTAMFSLMALLGYGLWLVRAPFLAKAYPFRWPLALAGLALYALAAVIEIKCRRHLKLRILVGMPELDEGDPGRLLTEGIYAHTRNPRYLDLIVGLAGWSLIVNYPAIYWLYIVTVAGLWVVVLFEERELAARFGAPYDEYRERVPRFIPRSWAFLRS